MCRTVLTGCLWSQHHPHKQSKCRNNLPCKTTIYHIFDRLLVNTAHFVNLEAVIREVDATTAMIVSSRSGGSRELLLANDADGEQHFSVCER